MVLAAEPPRPSRPRSFASRAAVLESVFLAPGVAALSIFFVWPVLTLLVASFWPAGAAWPSLAEYARFLSDPFYLGILWRTIRVGLIATLLTLIPGYVLAYALVFGARRWLHLILTICILLPLIVNQVIQIYGWYALLSPEGLINSSLIALGLTDRPQRILFTETAMLVGLAHSHIPFMALTIATALAKIDPSLLRAAQNLNATPFATFRHVVLPLSAPGMIAGCLMGFTLTISSYATPYLLGGARNKLITYLIYEQQVILGNAAFASAQTVILLVVTGLTILVYLRVSRGAAQRASVT